MSLHARILEKMNSKPRKADYLLTMINLSKAFRGLPADQMDEERFQAILTAFINCLIRWEPVQAKDLDKLIGFLALEERAGRIRAWKSYKEDAIRYS